MSVYLLNVLYRTKDTNLLSQSIATHFLVCTLSFCLPPTITCFQMGHTRYLKAFYKFYLVHLTTWMFSYILFYSSFNGMVKGLIDFLTLMHYTVIMKLICSINAHVHQENGKNVAHKTTRIKPNQYYSLTMLKNTLLSWWITHCHTTEPLTPYTQCELNFEFLGSEKTHGYKATQTQPIEAGRNLKRSTCLA